MVKEAAMAVLCKFKVGDVVEHVGVEVQELPEDEARKMPDEIDMFHREALRFFIVERLVQECPGGFQVHYRARPMNKQGPTTTATVQLNEIEVRASQPFKRIKVAKNP